MQKTLDNKAKLLNEDGMSTIEYAMGSLAAAALAAVLYAVINGGQVSSAITSIITDALSNTPV
ncbi:DUF4244 domain-containing protein [Corynebacterium minutissimum]|uniref:DUF4244 domain-containing protein n=1 Tax=Corynebacterium minutissimum TaxID=38301 RepID=A0A376CRY9_9CORY|nr:MULTISPECIES: DUF4244 domain-containing protein [Corynebacterium]OFR69617.1 hypothetical protein HMPREF2875_01235 [Corynebacterium sp. HMSC078H07]QRP59959.1 DUF4244 domain-containing protein [Corynebacterium minutissimum]QRP97539.1 DUF4244 domain-containing protein [Corynebacterium sp. FDAARGOS 1242]STC74051.1 Uncharacterised protein [Corynebacterium minutissimum]